MITEPIPSFNNHENPDDPVAVRLSNGTDFYNGAKETTAENIRKLVSGTSESVIGRDWQNGQQTTEVLIDTESNPCNALLIQLSADYNVAIYVHGNNDTGRSMNWNPIYGFRIDSSTVETVGYSVSASGEPGAVYVFPNTHRYLRIQCVYIGGPPGAYGRARVKPVNIDNSVLSAFAQMRKTMQVAVSILPLPINAASESTQLSVKANTDKLDIAISVLRDALRGVDSKTLSDVINALASVPVTGPLTDVQLRAADVKVSLDGEQIGVSNFPTTQSISAVSLPLPNGAATEESSQGILELLSRAVTWLKAIATPPWLEKSTNRLKQSAIIESGTVTTVTTVAGLTNLNGLNSDMLIRAQLRSAWHELVRSKMA